MMFNFALAIVGSCMVRQLPPEQKWSRYGGYCLILAFSANFPLVMSLASGNFGGFTKKMTVNATVSVLATLALAVFADKYISLSWCIAQATLLDPSSSLHERLPSTHRASWR